MNQDRPGWRAWGVLALVGIVGLLFFLDRGVLTELKTTLGAKIGLSNRGYSLLLTAFMAPYIASYFFAGMTVDRLGTRLSVALFVLGMSLATLLCGWSENLGQLAGSRLLLGVAEAGIMPAAFVAIARWFPVERKATALALASPIWILGSIMASPFVAAVTLRGTWRSAFWIPGAVGLGVAALWWWTETDSGAAPSSGSEKGMRAVIGERAFWGIFAVRILTDPFWFLLQFWQTAFLQEKFGLSLGAAARLLWIPPLGQALLGLALGWLSDRLISRGSPARRARALVLVGLAALTPCVFILAEARHANLAVAMLIIAQFIGRSWLAGTTLLASEIAPPGRMATVIGVMSGLGGISSVLLGAISGSLVDWLGYSRLFELAACVYPFAGLIIWRCYLARPRLAAA